MENSDENSTENMNINIFNNFNLYGESNIKLLLDKYGNIISNENNNENVELYINIYKNPKSYAHEEENISKSSWNHIASGIRLSNRTICKGQIGNSFFEKEKMIELVDVIFCLYLFKMNRLIGFSTCMDLSLVENDGDEEVKTFYIDSICGNLSNIRKKTKVDNLFEESSYNLNDELNDFSEIKIGKILLNTLELYAVNNDFEQMKLTSLPYVINYYRNIGYRHIPSRKSTENRELRTLAELNAQKRFKSGNAANEQMLVERCIQLSNNELDQLKNNLKRHFNLEQIPDNEETNTYLNKLSPLITIDNFKTSDGENGLYDFTFILTKYGFSDACKGTDIPTKRRWLTLDDEDFEYITKCYDDGFTMRKSIMEEDGWKELI